MPLKISYKTNENELRITISGQINISNAAEFEEELVSAIHNDGKNYVLDLADLDFISSAGMRVLILCSKNLAKHDKKITCLLNSQSRVKDVFLMAGLYYVMDIKEI